jgi:hypothetical protein
MYFNYHLHIMITILRVVFVTYYLARRNHTYNINVRHRVLEELTSLTSIS